MDTAAVSAITTAVDFGTIVVGIGAVFAALILVRMALTGGRMLMSAIK